MRTLAVYTLCVAFLCLPAILNGGPFFFHDSAGYLTAGKAFVKWFPFGCSGNVRSLSYSLLILIPSLGPNFWPVVLFQALAVVCVLDFVSRKIWAGDYPFRLALLILLLCVFTPITFSVDFVLPDIFTGLLIPLLFWLGPARGQLTGRQIGWIVAVCALFTAFHGSNWMLVLILLLLLRSRVILLSLLLSTLLNLVVNFAGCGQRAIFPTHPPWAVARLMDFGLVSNGNPPALPGDPKS